MKFFIPILLIVVNLSASDAELLELTNKCNNKDARSCTTLGMIYFGGFGDEYIDYTKSKGNLHAGCKYGDANACDILGRKYYEGTCLNDSSNKILNDFKQLVQDGNYMINEMINRMYKYEQCMKKDDKTAMLYYEKGCSLNSKYSCDSINKIKNKSLNKTSKLDSSYYAWLGYLKSNCRVTTMTILREYKPIMNDFNTIYDKCLKLTPRGQKPSIKTILNSL